MTTPEEALSELEALLREEHMALRAMKAARVGELARAKEIWFTRLVDSGAFTRPDLRPRLRELHASMQKNALLITYARDLTRDMLMVVGALAPAGYTRSNQAARVAPSPGRNLSTTG